MPPWQNQPSEGALGLALHSLQETLTQPELSGCWERARAPSMMELVDEAPHGGRSCGSQKPGWILGTTVERVQSLPKLACSACPVPSIWNRRLETRRHREFPRRKLPLEEKAGSSRSGQISSQWEEGLSAVCVALSAEHGSRAHTGLQHSPVVFCCTPIWAFQNR